MVNLTDAESNMAYPAESEGSLLAGSAADTQFPRLDSPAHRLTEDIETAVGFGLCRNDHKQHTLVQLQVQSQIRPSYT